MFPEIFCEEQIDFEKLKLALGEDNLCAQNERYQLNWAGKSDAYRTLQSPTFNTLAPCIAESVDFHDTQNVFIEAENLEALKILQKSYAGKVKMIYIDPPYNTGNDSFVYPDKFAETREEYAKRVGDKDQDGYLLRDGAFAGAWRKNSKDNGHYHSNWLSMMLPRLHLAKTLLREDGVIFISIDDNEQAQLKLLCDEVFGAENFIREIVWKKKTGSGTKIKHIFDEHEYILVYAKNEANLKEWRYTSEEHGNFSNPDNDERGAWESCALTAPSKNKNSNQLYGIRVLFNQNLSAHELQEIESKDNIFYAFNYLKHTVILEKADDTSLTIYDENKKEGFFVRRWAYIPSSMKKDIFSMNRVYFNNGNIPRYKKFETEYIGKALPSIYYEDFSTQQGTTALANILEDGLLEYPKSVDMLKFFISNVTQDSDIIMDFFAGSATTADAIFRLNQEKIHRKFICIQLPEELNPLDEKQQKAYKFCQSLGLPENIAEISKERIRRAGTQIRRSSMDARQNMPSENADTAAGAVSGINARPTVDTGFKVFKLTESHFKQWRRPLSSSLNAPQQLALLEEFQNVVHEHASVENMAYELMLRLGFELTDSIEFSGCVVWLNNAAQTRKTALLLDTVNQATLDEVRAQSPKKVFVLDKAFAGNDALKTNAALQFKDANIDFETL